MYHINITELSAPVITNSVIVVVSIINPYVYKKNSG